MADAPSCRASASATRDAEIQGHHRLAAFFVALIVAFVSVTAVQTISAEPPADRSREMERLIDAVASRNQAPKLIGKDGVAYPTFSDKLHEPAYPAFSDEFRLE